MAKTFEYSMKIPFDMSDVNGFIKIPQLILLSLQVSGMQSIELGMSDMYILENYNLVWIITDYNMKIERLPVFDEKITIETYAKSHNRLFCYRAFNIKDEAGNTIIAESAHDAEDHEHPDIGRQTGEQGAEYEQRPMVW